MAEPRRGSRLRDLFLCVLTGTLTFMAFPTAWAPELNLFWMIWFAHVPLMWMLRHKSPRAAFWWGWLCGLVTFTGGYYWIADLLIVFGGLPKPVAWLGLFLHSVHLGLMWALWAWLVNRVGNTTRVGIEWSAPLAMVAVELMVPRIFPAYMGNSQFSFIWVMQIADIFGVAAITFLIYRVNAVLFLWLRAKVEGRTPPRKAAIATGAMLALTLAYGGVRTYQIDQRAAEAPKLKIGLVENDVGIFQREPVEKQMNHLLVQQRLSAELEKAGAELIVWPESSYRWKHLPRDQKRFPPAKAPLVDDYRTDRKINTPREDRGAPIRGFSTPLMFGSTSAEPSEPRWEGDHPWKPYNTAWLLDRDGTIVGRYDKVYLLLFGEYVPFAKYVPWVYKKIPAAGRLEAGAALEVIEADLWDKGPVRFGVLICYEGLLPTFTNQIADQQPHLLVNITNDDWFGKTAERWLHFILTVPRAIEHRVAFVRGTLTGVSAFVDPAGRILQTTRPEDPETLLEEVPLLQSRTVYQVIGNAFSWVCLALIWLLYLWGRIRRA